MSDLNLVRLTFTDDRTANIKYASFAVDSGNPEMQPDALAALFKGIKAEGIDLEVKIYPIDQGRKVCTEKNIPLYDSIAKIEEVTNGTVQSFRNLETS